MDFSAANNGREFIELRFSNPVYVSGFEYAHARTELCPAARAIASRHEACLADARCG
jgi:hypothetical protein